MCIIGIRGLKKLDVEHNIMEICAVNKNIHIPFLSEIVTEETINDSKKIECCHRLFACGS